MARGEGRLNLVHGFFSKPEVSDGTKTIIARKLKKYDTIGIDLLSAATNDILVMGAKPLFFLDYYGTGKLESNVFEEVISGLSKACIENNCALIGGETAEMPGFYLDKKYDLAGFCVGIIDGSKKRKSIPKENDLVVGIESSGIHSNGFSLIRKLLKTKKSVPS